MLFYWGVRPGHWIILCFLSYSEADSLNQCQGWLYSSVTLLKRHWIFHWCVFLCMCICAYLSMCARVCSCMWKPEDSLCVVPLQTPFALHLKHAFSLAWVMPACWAQGFAISAPRELEFQTGASVPSTCVAGILPTERSSSIVHFKGMNYDIWLQHTKYTYMQHTCYTHITYNIRKNKMSLGRYTIS